LEVIEEITKLLEEFRKKWGYQNCLLSLIGGYAIIAHGVERVTRDIDFMVYCDPPEGIGKRLKSFLMEKFLNAEVTYAEASRDLEDPLKHDVVFLRDQKGEYPFIDFLIARYKWELEGLKKAKRPRDVPVAILPIPYLIAMKLRSMGFKDELDILELFQLASDEEKEEIYRLAKRVRREEKLSKILEKIHGIK